MTDEEIVLYFNEHRLAKLESYLLKDGSSVEHELQNLLDRFYEQTVPEHERMEVEAQIELEREHEAAAREASRRFAVVHFHEGDDDFFFTSELRNSFYSIANLYRSTLKDEIGKYTLDSIAQSNFSGSQTINDILVLPCKSQTSGWKQTDIDEYERIKAAADKVVYTSEVYYRGCMHKRNRHLMDNSSLCICYLMEDRGGTYYTVNYARENGLQIINLAE